MPGRIFFSVVAVVFLGVAHADEYAGTLIKVADGKVTFARGVGKKKKEHTLPADEKCRVFTAKYNAKLKVFETDEEIAGGLANPVFKQLDKQTVEAWIVTDAKGDTIRELRLYQSTTKKKTK